jgi:hypothetical protein
MHYRSWLLCRGVMLSAKPLRPSAKPLPSAVYRALGKAFAESPTFGKARNKKIRKKNLKKKI